MSKKSSFTSKLMEFAIIFAVAWLGSQLIITYFFADDDTPPPTEPVALQLSLEDDNIMLGHYPVAVIENIGRDDYVLQSRCPMPPLAVSRVTDAGTESLGTKELDLPCEEEDVRIGSGQTVSIDLSSWMYVFFNEAGTYELQVPDLPETKVTLRMSEPNLFIKLFRSILTKPFLNFLVFVADTFPGHNLGLAIIALTLLVKLILFFPTQHAMEGQRKMQLLQPKLNEIKTKYEGNAQKQHEETIKLWKEHNVNPLQMFLPMLIQFPVLIGLYFVIRQFTSLELAKEFLYPPYMHLDWSFNTMFLGIDLAHSSYIIFPPILALFQYLQLKLSFHIAKKKSAQDKPAASGQEVQQKVMQYAFPVMIAVFSLQVPAAVSLYWAISTLFGIGQQMYVNKEKLRV